MSIKHQTRICPVCGEAAYEPYLAKGTLSLVRCVRCAMVYVNPVISEMATGSFYDEKGTEYLSQDKLEGDYSEARFDRELRLLRKHCPGGSVLDVGCSSGGFLYALAKRYPGEYIGVGTDISSAPLDYAARMGVSVVRGNFLEHSFSERFDIVTFWAVMEHLMEPRLFLKKAASVLKPNGTCIILVPNLESLAMRLLGAKYRYVLPEHINYFSRKSLKTFVQSEFSVVDVTSTHFNPLVILKDFRSQKREVSRTERFELLRRTSRYKRSRWLFPLKVAYKTCDFVLGRLSLADNLAIVCRKK